jgi:hypothetical protein
MSTATAPRTTSTEPQPIDHHHQLVVTGPEPLVIDPMAKKGADLTEAEARLLTTEIKRTSVRLWLLVTAAHDRKAHVALGYKTWDDYARGELQMSPSRSYQLLDTGHVMHELAAAGQDIESLEPPPARVVARIKDRLPEVRRVAKRAVAANEPTLMAIRELAKEPQVTARVAKAAASSSGSGGSPGTGRGPVQCPACKGEGKVDRSLGQSLRAFLRQRVVKADG